MKIRSGFVSNSSSTSFCLVGVYFSDIYHMLESGKPEFTKKLVEKGFPLRENYKDDSSYEDAIYTSDPLNLIEDILGMEVLGFWDDQGIYIGRSFSSIDDDETPRKFKNDIKEELEKYFNGVKVKILEGTAST